MIGIIYTEALRTGHNKFGNRPLTTQEGQWALEHLDIIPQRIESLGDRPRKSAETISTDHEGNPAAKIVQWDGKEWHAKTDWLNGERGLFHDAIYAKAAAYAKERTCRLVTHRRTEGADNDDTRAGPTSCR